MVLKIRLHPQAEIHIRSSYSRTINLILQPCHNLIATLYKLVTTLYLPVYSFIYVCSIIHKTVNMIAQPHHKLVNICSYTVVCEHERYVDVDSSDNAQSFVCKINQTTAANDGICNERPLGISLLCFLLCYAAVVINFTQYYAHKILLL